jgi:hypothetical protein
MIAWRSRRCTNSPIVSPARRRNVGKRKVEVAFISVEV